jgi:hypothetical protein
MSPSSNSFKLFSAFTKFITKEEPKEELKEEPREYNLAIVQNFLDKSVHKLRGKYRDTRSEKETENIAILSIPSGITVKSFYTPVICTYQYTENDVLQSLPILLELVYDKNDKSVHAKFLGSSDKIIIVGSFTLDSKFPKTNILFYDNKNNSKRGIFEDIADDFATAGAKIAAVTTTAVSAVGAAMYYLDDGDDSTTGDGDLVDANNAATEAGADEVELAEF